MANPTVFFNNLRSATNQYVQILEQLNQYNDMLAQDATLAAAAAAIGAAQGWTNLSAADITNIGSAITQFTFTYNSGTPPQKSFLYKIL